MRTGKFSREARKGRKAKTNVIASGREKSFSSPGDVGGLGSSTETRHFPRKNAKVAKVATSACYRCGDVATLTEMVATLNFHG